MSETRNLFHLQCAAKMARNSTDIQLTWLKNRAAAGYDLQDSETIITLERKFFLNRNSAQKIIDKCL